MPDIEYEQEIFDLENNSSVIIYTDGIIEARNYNGKLFGTNRLLKVIENRPNDPDLIIKEITDKVDDFTITQGRSDDLTLLVFSQIKEEKEKPAHLSIKSHPGNPAVRALALT